MRSRAISFVGQPTSSRFRVYISLPRNACLGGDFRHGLVGCGERGDERPGRELSWSKIKNTEGDLRAMAASQDHITPNTPLSASLVPGGATFRVWAPAAQAVHVALQAPGQNPEDWRPGEADRLVRDGQGYWSGFFPGVEKGALYRFWTVGP